MGVVQGDVGGNVWRKIEGTITRTNQAVGTYATATWAAGAFPRIRLVIRQTARATTGGISAVTMVGLTGASRTSVHYNVDLVVAAANQATLYIGWANSIAAGVFEFDIPAAPALKTFSGLSELSGATNIQMQSHGGSNDDATHEVTGLGIVTVNDTCTFSYELYGLPA